MRKLIAKIKKTNPVMLWRYALLAFILIMVTVLGRLHQLDQRTFPSVDALCPFGGLESLYSLLFQGKFLERVFSSSLILLITTGLLALVAGRAFCGWLCPLGALQGIMHAMAKVFKRKQQPLLLNQDKYLRWAKYPVLIFFTAGAWIGGKMLIREFEPWVAYMHISELDRIFQEFPVGITLLLAILLTSLFISRPFCRYLCPMGALLGLVSRISLFRIRREEQACSKCTTTCPVGIDVARGSLGRGASLGQDTSSQGTSVPLSECLACGECVTACSKQASLRLQLHKLVLKPVHLGLLVPFLFFGLIGLTQLIGLYNSTPPTIEQLKTTGNLKPEDIKGYMTLTEVAYLFNLQLSELYRELDLEPALPDDTACRDLGQVTGRDIETDAARLAVARSLKIPEQDVVQSCSNSNSLTGIFIPGYMTLGEVAQAYKLDLDKLYQKLGLNRQQIPPTVQCRALKNLVHPNFHTTLVRDAVVQLINQQRF